MASDVKSHPILPDILTSNKREDEISRPQTWAGFAKETAFTSKFIANDKSVSEKYDEEYSGNNGELSL